MNKTESILVVDDHQSNRDLLRIHLQKKGYIVIEAEDGLQALSIIEAQPLDLVLLDIMMPGLDGIGVLKKVRRSYSSVQLPIIMVTAKHDSNDIVETMSLGANDYVAKPVDYKVLFIRMETILAHKRAEKALQESHQNLEKKVEQRTLQLQESLNSLEQEIEQRKKAEIVIRKREKKFRDFSEIASDWYWETDEKHRLTFVSERISEILGIPSDKALGQTPWELMGKDSDQGEFWNNYKVMRDAKLPFRNSHFSFTDQAGKTHHMCVSGKPIYNEDKDFVGFRGIGTDESSEIRSQQRSSEVERLLTAITENLQGVIFRRVLKPDGRIDYPFVSSAANKLTEMLAKDLKAGGFIALQAVYGDDVDRFQQAMHRSASELIPLNIEYRIIVNTNTIKWVHCSAIPHRSSSGDIVWDGVLQNIDERKNLEMQLSHAQKLESVGQLAAGIAHEINTPTQYVADNMHFIKESFDDLMTLNQAYEKLLDAAHAGNISKLLMDETESAIEQADLDFIRDEMPKALEQAMEGLQKIIVIVSAMKAFSHPGNEDMESVDINSLIENTIAVSSNEWKYVARIHKQLDPNLPAIMGYGGKLGQVFLNLIVNAAHAIAGEGGEKLENEGIINIQTCLLDDYVEVRISDTGPGVPESIKDKIFDPFFTTKEVGKGTGQGLSIAHSVVVGEHKGRMLLEQNSGSGAIFIMLFPLEAG